MVGKKRFIHSLKVSKANLYLILWLLFGFANGVITFFLYLEYNNYRDLTASLLDLQSKYETYILMLKSHHPDFNTDKKFLAVDRSEINLKDLVQQDHDLISETITTVRPVRNRAKKNNNLVGNNSNNSKAIFSWPVSQDSFWISSFFGPRRMGRVVRMHLGIDLAALKGTPVYAAAGGKVIKACYEFGYGNTIVIEHNRKYKTRYAHLDEILVEHGQNIGRGQKIGAVGDTGFVQAEGNNASHLHFEVYAFNKQVNPIAYLPRR